MKTDFKIFNLLLVLCGSCIATAVVGQTTRTWTGGGDGTNIASAANWGGTLPVSSNGDIAQFDGVVPGDLQLSYISGLSGNYNDTNVLTWSLTASQTGSVTFDTPVAVSGTFVVGNISVAAGAGALTFGGTNSFHLLWLVARPSSAIHDWVNNSTNPVTFNPWIRWASQGGASWTEQFSGAGDWHLNNYMVNFSGGDNLVVVNGPGAVYWNPGGFLGANSFWSPLSINGGKLVLQAYHPRINSQQIVNGAVFEFDAPGSAQTLSGNITGPGELRVSNGTLTLAGTNDYTGSTVVSNGTLIINGANSASSTHVFGGALGGTGTLSGPVTLDAGTTLAPGAPVGTLTINNNLTLGGNVAIEVDKSLAQSNDLVEVTGVLQNTGAGALTVANLGPALAARDKFTVFSKAVAGGSGLTVTGAGATWQNDLETDGSITALTVTPSQPTLNYTSNGGSLNFSWPGSGYKLQSQTNSVGVGLANNWVDYSGGGTSPVSVPIGLTNGAVFFRLISTP